MLFNSIEFLIFFPIAVSAYYLFPKGMRNYWLLVCSYYFYMCWNPKYIFLLIGTTLVTYVSGLLLEFAKNSDMILSGKENYKKLIVAVSLIVNIGLLFYFKYINFAIDILENVMSYMGVRVDAPVFDVVLPVGISFYIFQALSYTMDVYRDEVYAERNLFRYALFVSFFPQLVAGPIERSKKLLRQLATPSEFKYDNVRAGLLAMFWGYFLKLVIADRCAIVVDQVYGNLDSYQGMELILAGVLFSIQIYCDFMSYSTIAKGAAKVLGYELMENFNLPYFSTSIKDFWRRWHISLSSWLRDYLYISLGGSKKGILLKYANILFTFLISGLWHGADITFVLWGICHGVLQIFGDIISTLFEKAFGTNIVKSESRYIMTIKVFVTFVFVDLAWVLFRADNLSDAMTVYRRMWYHDGLGMVKTKILDMGLDRNNWYLLLIGIFVLFVSSVMRSRQICLREWISSKIFVARYALYWSAMIMIMLSMDITGKEFIYFQF